MAKLKGGRFMLLDSNTKKSYEFSWYGRWIIWNIAIRQ